MVESSQKVGAIIQARVGSTRLPNKVLRPVKGQPLIWHLLERIMLSEELDQIVVALPKSRENDVLVEWVKQKEVAVFRGSENDVLSRYLNSAKHFGIDVIIRICSDDPFIDPRVLDKAVKSHLESGADYTANNLERTYPLGFDLEVFDYEVLETLDEKSTKDHQREHVTAYIKEHPDEFKLNSVTAEEELLRPDLRLTVDQEEDLTLVRKIFDHLYQEGEIFETKQVIDFLDKHPVIASINEEIKQKEVKK